MGHIYDWMAVYSTHDGGLSWTPNPALFENCALRTGNTTSDMIDFISPRDALFPAGMTLRNPRWRADLANVEVQLEFRLRGRD